MGGTFWSGFTCIFSLGLNKFRVFFLNCDIKILTNFSKIKKSKISLIYTRKTKKKSKTFLFAFAEISGKKKITGFLRF